jgi:hypothetical protein
MIIVRMEIWSTCTTKNSKRLVVQFFIEQTLKWGFIAKNFARRSVDEENGHEESIVPIF